MNTRCDVDKITNIVVVVHSATSIKNNACTDHTAGVDHDPGKNHRPWANLHIRGHHCTWMTGHEKALTRGLQCTLQSGANAIIPNAYDDRIMWNTLTSGQRAEYRQTQHPAPLTTRIIVEKAYYLHFLPSGAHGQKRIGHDLRVAPRAQY